MTVVGARENSSLERPRTFISASSCSFTILIRRATRTLAALTRSFARRRSSCRRGVVTKSPSRTPACLFAADVTVQGIHEHKRTRFQLGQRLGLGIDIVGSGAASGYD